MDQQAIPDLGILIDLFGALFGSLLAVLIPNFLHLEAMRQGLGVKGNTWKDAALQVATIVVIGLIAGRSTWGSLYHMYMGKNLE